MKKKNNWGAVILDICIMCMAVGVSVWQNNPKFLWLLAFMFATGSITIKE